MVRRAAIPAAGLGSRLPPSGRRDQRVRRPRRAVHGQVVQGAWYDTGHLVAQPARALARPEYGPVLDELTHRNKRAI